MKIIEIIMVSAGLSFDILALTVCQGAQLASVNKKKLCIVSLLYLIWQMVALGCGTLVSYLPLFRDSRGTVMKPCCLISSVIFLAMACYFLFRAWQRKPIEEHRRDINYKEVCVAAVATSLDAFIAGIGMGLLSAEIVELFFFAAVMTVICVALGIYIGYRLGYEQKTKAYFIGGVLFAASGMKIMIQYLS